MRGQQRRGHRQARAYSQPPQDRTWKAPYLHFPHQTHASYAPTQFYLTATSRSCKDTSQRMRIKVIWSRGVDGLQSPDYGDWGIRDRGIAVKLRYVVVLEALLTSMAVGVLPQMAPALYAATPKKGPVISEEASAALTRMGETLRGAEQFSFQARTIRVYSDANGQPLHISHTLKVVVHKPNRMLVDVTG